MIFLKNPFALYVLGCTRYITLCIFPISQYQYFPLSLLTRVLLISLKSVIEAKSGREGFSSSHSIFTKLWFSKSWNIGNIKFVEIWFFKPELLPVPQDCGQMCSLGSFCLGKIKIIRKICQKQCNKSVSDGHKWNVSLINTFIRKMWWDWRRLTHSHLKDEC